MPFLINIYMRIYAHNMRMPKHVHRHTYYVHTGIHIKFEKTDSAYHSNGRFILIIGRAIPKNDDFSIWSCILQNNCVILHSIIDISIQL